MSLLSEAWSLVYNAFGGNEFLMLTFGKAGSYIGPHSLCSLGDRL